MKRAIMVLSPDVSVPPTIVRSAGYRDHGVNYVVGELGQLEVSDGVHRIVWAPRQWRMVMDVDESGRPVLELRQARLGKRE